MGRSRLCLMNELPPLSSWPKLDTRVLEKALCDGAERRIKAIELYFADTRHREIEGATGIGRGELNRLLHRCIRMAADGRIFGYRALVPGVHLSRYTRKAPVLCSVGAPNKGATGALGQLFERFPQLQRYIHRCYLQPEQPRKKGSDARARVCDVHSKFIDWLTKEGLTPSEWPLNTSTEGLEALRTYCTGLLGERPDEWIRAHSGRNAAARLAVGKGIAPILPTLRPFGAVQLDFHKVDSACIISIINPFGAEIKVPLARWHIGLIVEERFDLILGAVLALETTPSSDSVLETIESALVPITVGDDSCALAIGIGRKVFPNQIFSSLAQGQCFSILRMDNGWSNTALDVIDNVIDTIGCAVHYGPVRAWWGRDTIERVFGQVTRSGLQRSPATYGSNPLDSRKKDSNEEALILEIRLSDLTKAIEHQIALHNASRTEALLMGSPISALEAAMTNPASGFILSPLPANPSELPLLMYHVEVRAVRGDIDKGERPYVKLGKWRYTNERLSSDFLFIGRNLRLYVSRRDPRIVFASCVETGEDMGRLNPPNRFLDVSVSWRARALLQRAGGRQRRIERREMNADHWMGIEAGDAKPSAKASTGRGLGKQALKAAKAAVMRDISEPFVRASVVPFTEQASSLATHDRAGWLSLDAKVQISEPCEGDAP